MLTGADERGGRLADVVVVGIAFDGEGGDVVQHTWCQAAHDMGGLLPVQEVRFAVIAAQRTISNDEATDQAVGRVWLIPAQLHLVLSQSHHMETRGWQQVWEQWEPYMSNPYIK